MRDVAGYGRQALGWRWFLRALAVCAGFGWVTAGPVGAAVGDGSLRVLSKHAFETGAPKSAPVQPEATQYALANPGSAAIDWSATTTAPWLELDPPAGTLQPGSRIDITARVLQSFATGLDFGVYSDTIAFRDRTHDTLSTEVSARLWIGIHIEEKAWLRVYGKKLFPIYVWQQPPTESWVSYYDGLGVNTYMRNGFNPAHSTNPELLDALQAHGMYGLLWLDGGVVDHPALIGWTLSDEPVHNNYSESKLENEYAAVRAIDPHRPILINFDSKFYWDENFGSSSYESKVWQFVDIPELVSFDFYPVTGWNKPQWTYIHGAATEFMLDHYLDYQKPVWDIVEASDQNLSWTPPETPGPSPAQMRFEVWDAIIHGATGIGYFTHSFNPHEWANLTPEIEAEMVRTNAQIAELSNVILSPRPPLVVSGTELAGRNFDFSLRRRGRDYFLLAANADMQYRTERVTFAFEQTPTLVEVFGENRSITPAGKRFTDDFAPVEVHIYRIRF